MHVHDNWRRILIKAEAMRHHAFSSRTWNRCMRRATSGLLTWHDYEQTSAPHPVDVALTNDALTDEMICKLMRPHLILTRYRLPSRKHNLQSRSWKFHLIVQWA